MKTKAEIVQKLLEESKINAEEAVILLMSGNSEVHYVPFYPQPIPFNPWYTPWIITNNAPLTLPNYSTV